MITNQLEQKSTIEKLDLTSIANSIKEPQLIEDTQSSTSPVFKIIITQNIETAANIDSNKVFNIRKIILIPNKEQIEKNKTINKIYDQLHIFCQVENNKEIQIDGSLSQNCKKAILNFLLNGRPSPKYCCVDFVMDAFGIYSNSTVNSMTGKWTQKNLDESSLNPGDAIIIYNESSKPMHFAIYLTHGIYLSLFGSVGSLSATNLEQMKIAFDGVRACKLNCT